MSLVQQQAHPIGTQVRFCDQAALENFRRRWNFHNPLQPSTLDLAGQLAVVDKFGFYHGGDQLYVLRDVPGVWHESCLSAADDK
jgi:hypothetical protein